MSTVGSHGAIPSLPGTAPTTPRGTEIPTLKPKSAHKARPPTKVHSQGAFPAPGSILGPYFFLGRLGKGTFCSIHKCIYMHYHYPTTKPKPRLAAAKVELDTFTNSGVLDGEAMMLSHLDHVLPPKTVPIYMGHFAADKASAIVMEFLAGDDMHQLREANGSRRMTVDDAVYLTADVLLPLLREMHEAGVVHRDVKPSNCVRRDGKEFAMVDFGLSKNILVEKDHPAAGFYFNPTHCLREERTTAEFRGTSMYASLRVHQGKDFTFRDDMWSLLYVFCDLISGGLPWMSYAANRDRDACQRVKEEIHGDAQTNNDKTEIMLFGEEYFLAKFKYDTAKKEGKDFNVDLPEPMEMSKDKRKVELLRKSFKHLAGLGFNDMPDYGTLQENIHGFLESPPEEKIAARAIVWKPREIISPDQDSKRSKSAWDRNVPTWDFKDVDDPLDVEPGTLWSEAESQVIPDTSIYGASTESADLARLPLDFQFRIAQMNFHRQNGERSPPQVALRDWMKCSLYLLYGEWDSTKFERGNHRTNTDGYRRDLFLNLVDKCLQCALAFKYWTDPSIYFEDGIIEVSRKRKILSSAPGSNGSDLVTISRVLTFLRHAKKFESKKKTPPPPSLSQGYRA